MADFDLTGRVSIVTGANHGIGAAIARALARRGAPVILAYLRVAHDGQSYHPAEYVETRSGGAAALVEEITRAGGSAAEIEADLTNDGSPLRIFDLAEEEFGPVQILVNNASGWIADTFSGSSPDSASGNAQPVTPTSIDRSLAVDARGSGLMISEYAKRHRAASLDWGRIVGITSGGSMGFPGEVSYGAAKAAMENYTMSAAFELAERGITANVVHPPVTDTGWITDEVRARVDSSRDLVNIATPEQVAEIIAFLCSDEAGLVTANRIHLR